MHCQYPSAVAGGTVLSFTSSYTEVDTKGKRRGLGFESRKGENIYPLLDASISSRRWS